MSLVSFKDTYVTCHFDTYLVGAIIGGGGAGIPMSYFDVRIVAMVCVIILFSLMLRMTCCLA